MREIDRVSLKDHKEYTMWYVKDGFHMAVVIAAKSEAEAYTRFHNLGFRGWVRTTEFKTGKHIKPEI